MDAFKPSELARMSLGGNDAWREFWEEHAEGGGKGLGEAGGKAGKKQEGRMTWEDTTIEERYSGPVGAEWKERLSARVEGRGYVPPRAPNPAPKPPPQSQGEARASPARTASPASSALGGAGAAGAAGRKAQNEAFFARKGDENAARSAHLPPSQGGKYGGFGSEPAPAQAAVAAGGDTVLPGVDEFAQDPVKAVARGLGWFAGAVGKGAKSVGDGWIRPAVEKVRLRSCLRGFSRFCFWCDDFFSEVGVWAWG